MQTHKILTVNLPNKKLQARLCDELGISYILAQLLINRGISSTQEAEGFLRGGLDRLHDPYCFSDMRRAVEIIKDACRRKEKVLLFSDYDADGVTSLALLTETLLHIGIDAEYYIPHRVKEGYGLNKNILTIARDKKIKLLITADCGTSSHEYISALTAAGTKVIVTDHHEPVEPNAVAFPAAATINPKLKQSGYPYRDLAGVGVAYKLCQALRGKPLEEELDLVAIGTIADAVPLTGENRIIVKEGLMRLPRTKRPGLLALMETSRIKNKRITPHFISFILGPRINASGRVDTAETALQLLLSRTKGQAEELARIIEGHNRQRQKIESEILEEAQALIDKEVNFKDHTILVVAKEGWHMGVLGVVAAKLTERFYRPTILISMDETRCKGSGRSIENFHLFQGVSECRDLLENFGGHKHAVGLVIQRDNIETFKNRINLFARERLAIDDLLRRFNVDMEVGLSEVNETVIRELEYLAPFGNSNPEPLLYTRNLRVKGSACVLGRETLKFWVTDGSVTMPAIGFGMASLSGRFEVASTVDLVYSPKIDSWRDGESPILEVKEIFFKR
ncbi:MAG: single-stranded-DNA-specific exonuclease RecJ [Candidatus Omnitrophota bacterium]|jgi:single-stranded-DNA-specific exonuclease|nr:MAG: single-stranded-DNA-specific exonuclease RecJ [Candidatus Omnitrophota bacterium]